MITRNQEIHHPKIRRFFKSTDELAELLGRSRNYTTEIDENDETEVG